VFLGVYPKPVLERMQPAVDRLISHVEDNSDFVSPEVDRPVVADEGGEGDEAEDEQVEEPEGDEHAADAAARRGDSDRGVESAGAGEASAPARDEAKP
jgi:hypothetical protein